jgi:2-keto-3-deoxy-L-rhamnonate aldolase RhmA
MRPNHTLSLLRAGKPAFGIWFASGQPMIARLLAYQGLMDWMMIDGEHTPIDASTASLSAGFIADTSRGACTPLLRVTAGTVDQIKRALDGGAQGVLVPLVNTPQQAAEVVEYAKYPPHGARGNGGLLPHVGYATNRLTYTEHAHRETMVAIQIETQEAVENIDAILSVPGIDSAFIGPNDLHISYGLPPGYWTPDGPFHAAVTRVLAACARHNVIPGILAANPTQAKARIADGFKFVGMGSDVSLMLNAVGAGFGLVTGAAEPAGGWAGHYRPETSSASST